MPLVSGNSYRPAGYKLHSGNTFREKLKTAVLVIVQSFLIGKHQRHGTLGRSMTPG
jgi:hypothetical protein